MFVELSQVSPDEHGLLFPTTRAFRARDTMDAFISLLLKGLAWMSATRTHGQLMLPPSAAPLQMPRWKQTARRYPPAILFYGFKGGQFVAKITTHLPGLRALVAGSPAFAFNSLARCCACSASCFLPNPLQAFANHSYTSGFSGSILLRDRN
jgi:hypothetical protein